MNAAEFDRAAEALRFEAENNRFPCPDGWADITTGVVSRTNHRFAALHVNVPIGKAAGVGMWLHQLAADIDGSVSGQRFGTDRFTAHLHVFESEARS